MNKLLFISSIGFIILSGMSCLSTAKFNSGEEAFDRKFYYNATLMLEKELEKTNDKEQIAWKSYLLGESYKQMGKPEKAVFWYEKSLKSGGDKVVYIKLTAQYKKLEEYDKAIATLYKYREKYGNSAILQRELAICNQARKWFENPDTNIIISQMPINSAYSEFASDYYLEDYIVVSSDRYNSSKSIYAWAGRYFYDLFIVDNHGISNLKSFSDDVNSKYNDASACFNKEGTVMFFVRCGDEETDIQNCKIYSAKRISGSWSDIKVLPFVQQGSNYLSPFLSEDGRILYFSSDVGSEDGTFDIFFSLKSGDKWSEPKKLPIYINTKGNEKFITTWKDEIYFSSDYLVGLGGLDIFKTSIDSQGRFEPPIHLDYPINSGGDDFYLLKDNDSGGIFSSSRIGGVGQDDIYKFRILPVADIEILKDSSDIKEKEAVVNRKVYLAIKVVENVFLEPDNPNSKVLGVKAVSGATLHLGDEIIKTPSSGVVIREVKFDSLINIVVGKPRYLSQNISINIENEDFYKEDITTINIRIVLDKIYLGKEIVLKDIFYDFDKWDLRDESKPTLDMLYNILKNNSEYIISIGSHTDCQGEEEYNITLSQRRAQSVIDYLSSKGIDKERLMAKGYGESKPIEKCDCSECSELQHQRNRRTTFKLLK